MGNLLLQGKFSCKRLAAEENQPQKENSAHPAVNARL
jgi:hypothetical protein